MNGTIFLIDAYAQIFRGFYALPPMTNSQGIYTNAVFAFSRFLMNLEKEYSPQYGAVVFDFGKCTARLDILPDYKANRPPTPEELKAQVPHIKEMISAFGYPVLQHEGIEADDLIGAIAMNFKDYRVKIISADKDLAQLIDERVEMLIPGRKGGGFDLRGIDEVIAKFAVKPEQIVDYLSLIGDSSDNIPGIAGVGPKTAAKLINECGSIEEMLNNPSLIEKEKLRTKITEAADILRKNIRLIQLDLKLPDESWKDENIIRKSSPHWAKIAKIAETLELKTFLRDVNAYCEKNGINLKSDEEQQNELPLFQEDASSEKPANSAKEKVETDNAEAKLYTPDLF